MKKCIRKCGGGVCAIALLLLVLLATVLVACNGNETDGKAVTLTAKDITVFVGDEFLPEQMFELKVDGSKATLSEADDVVITKVNTASAGTFDVECSLKVDGKSYSAKGKLTVVQKRAATLESANNILVPVTIGEQFDFTTLFNATVAGEPYALSADDIDLSAVDLTKEGLYTVRANIVIDNTPYSAFTSIYVIDEDSLDLASALSATYDNYTVKLTATQDDASYTEIRKIAPNKYAYEEIGKIWSYVYEIGEDGYVKQGYKYDSEKKEWSKSSDGNDSYVFRYLNPEDLSEDQFFLTTEGNFRILSTDEYDIALIIYALTGLTDGYGTANSVDVRVEGRKIVKVTVNAEEGEFVHEYYDFGNTEIEIPYVEPVVAIEALPAEVTVNTVTEYDFASMFSITVDGRPYTLSAEEKSAMIDSSEVKFDQAGEYNVVLNFTAPDGKVKHTKTAVFTVKEPSILTFKEALLAAANNCTINKVTSSSTTLYYVNGNNCFDNNASTLYDLSSFNSSDGSINTYKYENGALATTASSSKTRVPHLDMIAAVADEFVEGENGIYTYTGSAINDIVYACAATTKFGVRVEVDYANGSVSAIRIVYKMLATSKTDTTLTMNISAVGTTVLPAQLP